MQGQPSAAYEIAGNTEAAAASTNSVRDAPNTVKKTFDQVASDALDRAEASLSGPVEPATVLSGMLGMEALDLEISTQGPLEAERGN